MTEFDSQMADASDNSAEQYPEEYVVEKIVEKCLLPGNIFKYRVRWKDYPPDQDTWEPIEHLTDCSTAVEQFERCLQKFIKKECRKSHSDVVIKTPVKDHQFKFKVIYPIELDPDDYLSESSSEESSVLSIEHEILHIEDFNLSSPHQSPRKKLKSKSQRRRRTNSETERLSSDSITSAKVANRRSKCKEGDSVRPKENGHDLGVDRLPSVKSAQSKPKTSSSTPSASNQAMALNSKKTRKTNSNKSETYLGRKPSKEKPCTTIDKVHQKSLRTSLGQDLEDLFGFERGKKLEKLLDYIHEIDAFHLTYSDGEEEYLPRETANEVFEKEVIEFYERRIKYVHINGKKILQRFIKTKSVADVFARSPPIDSCFDVQHTPDSSYDLSASQSPGSLSDPSDILESKCSQSFNSSALRPLSRDKTITRKPPTHDVISPGPLESSPIRSSSSTSNSLTGSGIIEGEVVRQESPDIRYTFDPDKFPFDF